MQPVGKTEIIFLYHGSTSLKSIQNPANYSLPRLILYLHKQGYKVTVYNTETDELVDEHLIFKKFKVSAYVRQIIDCYRNKRKFLVVFHQGGNFKNILSRTAFYLRKIIDYRLVVRVGGVYFGEHQLNSPQFDVRQYSYLKNCDHFISVEDGTAVRLFAQKVKIPPHKVTTYVNGFPAKVNVTEPRANKIVCVSRLSHEKAVDYVVRSFHRALPHLTEKYALHIIGEGPEYNNLKQLTVQLGIANDVVFEGVSNDWVYHFSSSKLILAGLVYNPLMEAICTSTPVIALDLGSSKDIFAGFQNVYLVDYPRGGYGRIPDEYMDSLVEKTADKVVSILNGGYRYPSIDFDEEFYSWEKRLMKETELYEKMLQ